MMKSRMRLLGILVMAMVMMGGCSEQSRKKFKRNCQVCFFSTLALAGGIFALWCVGERQEKKRAIEKANWERYQKQLREAPRSYNYEVQGVLTWIPQCADIVVAEGKTGRAFMPRSPSHRARRKSLKRISDAEFHLDLMFNNDISSQAYFAKKDLMKLRGCCTECPKHNKESAKVKCLALRVNPRLDIDVCFNVGHGGD